MFVYRAQYLWQQPAGSSITAPVIKYYNLFHFCTPVDIVLNGKKIHTEENACIFLRPMEERKFYFVQQSTMNWIHAFDSIGQLLTQYDIPCGQIIYPTDGGLIAEIIRKMHRELILPDSFQSENMDALTNELLIHLSRSAHTQKNGINDADRGKISKVRAAIFAQAQRRWTVAEMAQMVSLSPSRFHALYKQAFQTSPMKDLINAKIDRAKTLLLMDDGLAVSQLAEQLGYQSEQHFIVQFKKHTGTTPAAYRRRKR